MAPFFLISRRYGKSKMQGSRNSGNIYIPVCIYASSFYQKKKNVKKLFSTYVKNATGTLIIVCDILHAYDLILQNPNATVKEAFNKAINKGNNIHCMLSNIRDKHCGHDNVLVKRWNEIAESEKYISLHTHLCQIVAEDRELNDVLKSFIKQHVIKFRWKIDKEAMHWEKKYILGEIAMSICVTEIMGYKRELWENPPKPDFSDPIGYLYKDRPEIVRALTNTNVLNRRLEIINKDNI